MYRDRIEEFFKANGDRMVADICSLIEINSVRTAAQPGKPFGEGPALAFERMAQICGRLGLECENHGNYVLTARTGGAEEKLGILAHLDVVEAGIGWNGDPFVPVISDGKIFGRGSSDDKGPAVAAAYALAAAHYVMPDMPFGVTLITGGAEETGSEDIRHYFADRPYPPMSFSPDAAYPVINIEKGAYGPEFGADWEDDGALPRVVELIGGRTNNIVPQFAHAVIEGISREVLAQTCADAAQKTGVRFEITPCEVGFSVSAEGQGAHASMPQIGNNAQTALIYVLTQLPLADGEGSRMLKKLAALFPHGVTDGSSLAIAQSDEISGALTLNFGVLEFTTTGFRGRFDSRVPICGTPATVSQIAADRLESNGIKVSTREMRKPHYTPEDSPLVKTLLNVYESYTGLPGECIAIGGGTYVHDIEGGVAFGCEVADEDCHIHGPNEFADIQLLLLSAKMFTQVIIDICGAK